MVHTNAIAYGFIASAFLGMLHWVVPRLTRRPVLSTRLSWFIFSAWQVVVLSTAVGILLGEAQGVEWGETPVWIDPLALAGLLLVAINFLAPIVRTPGPLYVTLWYFMAALVWTFLTYAMGNFIPQYFIPGTGGGAIAGMFIHDLVGLFVTPIGWGLMYYFVPIVLKRATPAGGWRPGTEAASTCRRCWRSPRGCSSSCRGCRRRASSAGATSRRDRAPAWGRGCSRG
jgi:cytochrome c oxidase cbb3-type subunit 1